jgi:phage recombination protein Bet
MTDAAVQEREQEHTNGAIEGAVVEPESKELVARAGELPAPVMRRGITEGQWRMLFNLFPGARPDSALMVWDYCKARNLDPMKKPCHIVQMDVKVGNTWVKRDVVMPGIYEYRITAHRTNTYLGHSKPLYGPLAKISEVEAPEFCEMTFYRWHPEAKRIIEFPVTVFFSEVVATTRDGHANARWTKAPRQMLTKCTEAAGLREGWPEEFGGEPTAEEMEGREIVVEAVRPEPPVEPVRRSEKAAAATPVEPVASTKPGEPQPAVEEPQTKPAAPAPPAVVASEPKSIFTPTGPMQVTKKVRIDNTAVIDKKKYGVEVYEISGIADPGIGSVWLTTSFELYRQAASCEGTGSKFHVSWHQAKVKDGAKDKTVKVITGLEAD